MLITLFSTNSFAQDVDLRKVEDYLNSIRTAKAGFFQADQYGGMIEGEFSVKKPGKFRWDYIDTKILIVSDGKTITYYDKELEQKNYLSVNDTVASLLARENIKLGIDAEVLEVVNKGESTHVKLKYRKQTEIKEFSLVFQNEPFTLGKMEVVDKDDNHLSITLVDFMVNSPMEDQIFIIDDKRLF